MRAQVTLVDRNPTHIWKPLLHEVAAGSMDPFTQELEYAAQARWHGFEFQQGELTGTRPRGKRLTLGTVLDDDGAELTPQRELEYDTLIIAIGSTTAFLRRERRARIVPRTRYRQPGRALPQAPDRGMHARRASGA